MILPSNKATIGSESTEGEKHTHLQARSCQPLGGGHCQFRGEEERQYNTHPVGCVGKCVTSKTPHNDVKQAHLHQKQALKHQHRHVSGDDIVQKIPALFEVSAERWSLHTTPDQLSSINYEHKVCHHISLIAKALLFEKPPCGPGKFRRIDCAVSSTSHCWN